MNSYPSFTQLMSLLTPINQQHLLEHWDQLSLKEQSTLAQQISELDTQFLKKQQNLLSQPISSSSFYEPILNFSKSGENKEWRHLGSNLLANNKVACVVLAGGQGSRLKYDGPKGLFPITSIKKKTLYQLIAEKVVAASNLANQDLSLAFMSSPLNQIETINYFEANNYFNLKKHQIDFFNQPLWPFLNKSKKLFLNTKSSIAMGPNGNGSLASSLYNSGIWDKWFDQGIKMVCIIPIDNPLALPFDLELCGFHEQQINDVSIKAIHRKSPDEDVGVLVKSINTKKTRVIEYSEINEKERFALNENGSLKYGLANIGLYCLSMDFIKKVANIKLPLYRALKQIQKFENHTQGLTQAWKFEEFIFDLFDHSNQCSTLVYPRQECFAPLKNLQGNHSLNTVQQALSHRERQLFHNITGCQLDPNMTLELEADFYYPLQTTAHQWKSKAFFEVS